LWHKVRLVNPDAPILKISARTGDGLQTWHDWLRGEAATIREFAPL
jgi:hypothetical protein